MLQVAAPHVEQRLAGDRRVAHPLLLRHERQHRVHQRWIFPPPTSDCTITASGRPACATPRRGSRPVCWSPRRPGRRRQSPPRCGRSGRRAQQRQRGGAFFVAHRRPLACLAGRRGLARPAAPPASSSTRPRSASAPLRRRPSSMPPPADKAGAGLGAVEVQRVDMERRLASPPSRLTFSDSRRLAAPSSRAPDSAERLDQHQLVLAFDLACVVCRRRRPRRQRPAGERRRDGILALRSGADFSAARRQVVGCRCRPSAATSRRSARWMLGRRLARTQPRRLADQHAQGFGGRRHLQGVVVRVHALRELDPVAVDAFASQPLGQLRRAPLARPRRGRRRSARVRRHAAGTPPDDPR